MPCTARQVEPEATLPLRMLQRREANAQIVHDTLHRRPGWVLSYFLEIDREPVGFGSVAIAGPWTGKPTAYECYVVPQHRALLFDLFEAFLDASQPAFLEFQTNDPLVDLLLHTYGREGVSESIVFADALTSHLPAHGTSLRARTSQSEVHVARERRQGGGEWSLESGTETVATGGLLFHYNRPYTDVYMEVGEPFRRRGYGAYLVQELKRLAYELGAIPAARCSPSNLASRRTLARAGFVPVGHIVNARLSR
ncbi:MAG: GNAT family N-acetyltransferase [Verrucomicrobiales bacterium]|nr:GNAT family N-acetyltransferase [Verrucomicrobiales bacterium]